MDPDANHAEQMKLAARLMEAIENGRDVDRDDALRLTELVIALDEWLASGGFLPRAWRK